jgi:hypothetical protein
MGSERTDDTRDSIIMNMGEKSKTRFWCVNIEEKNAISLVQFSEGSDKLSWLMGILDERYLQLPSIDSPSLVDPFPASETPLHIPGLHLPIAQ